MYNMPLSEKIREFIPFFFLFLVHQTEADKKLLGEKGGIPIGIGKNCHIRRAIIDKNARIGDNVKVFQIDFLIVKHLICLYVLTFFNEFYYSVFLISSPLSFWFDFTRS